MGDFFELISRRESCRDYSDRPVEREKLERMIEAARLAPSAVNSQSWFYTVVTGKEAVAAVRRCAAQGGMNRFVLSCSAFVVVEELGPNLLSRLGGAVKDQQYTQIDLGLSVMQLLLAATEVGLSTCMLGWFDRKGLEDALGLGHGRPRLVICVGYAADGRVKPKKRKPMERIARFIE
ncbi:MAG: NAD(P)H nitroreductase [Clostridiales bacterium]|nr:NAD(P)H nitroreductase [Clostridiales bacterium]